MKFHLKTWSLLSGMSLSLALIAGCSQEEAAPEANTPASTTTETAPAAPATPPAETPAATSTTPAEPAPAVEPPKAEPAPAEPTEAPK